MLLALGESFKKSDGCNGAKETALKELENR